MVDNSFQTNREGIFACGNVLHVHDLVDFVSMEAERLADSAADYVRNGGLEVSGNQITTDKNINHTVPQRFSGKKDLTLSMRVSRPMKDCEIVISQNGTVIKTRKMKKAIPAEMIQIPVPAALLSEQGDMEVSVR